MCIFALSSVCLVEYTLNPNSVTNNLHQHFDDIKVIVQILTYPFRGQNLDYHLNQSVTANSLPDTGCSSDMLLGSTTWIVC